jgi:hypothetical protein
VYQARLGLDYPRKACRFCTHHSDRRAQPGGLVFEFPSQLPHHPQSLKLNSVTKTVFPLRSIFQLITNVAILCLFCCCFLFKKWHQAVKVLVLAHTKNVWKMTNKIYIKDVYKTRWVDKRKVFDFCFRLNPFRTYFF